jgi:hypothetical protein
MSNYRKLLARLGASTALCNCQDGVIKAPMATLDAPFGWYGYPPALIPIWSDGSSPSYLGIWKHWFIEREMTYVETYLESGCRSTEIARTEDQLFSYVIILAITAHDGISPGIVDFAKRTGVNNLDEIDQLTLDIGDNTRGFSRLPQFASKTPLEMITEAKKYDGEFPSEQDSLTLPWAEKTCSFEYKEQSLVNWPKNVEKPAWLAGQGRLERIFDEMLAVGDFGKAWLTLNSTGWKFSEAVTAIRRLASAAGDESFSLLASAWVENAENDPGRY